MRTTRVSVLAFVAPAIVPSRILRSPSARKERPADVFFASQRRHSCSMSAETGAGAKQYVPLSTEEQMQYVEFETEPIEGQKTGTSGLRVRTRTVLSEPRFVPNFVQALFNALGGHEELRGDTLVVGGDGRFYNLAAIQTILRLAAANGISRVFVGRDGLLSTPAVSALIPRVRARGGIVLTASHNPGGVDGDWGIKYNTESGAPALESLTSRVHAETRKITSYRLADLGGDVGLSCLGETSFGGGSFVVDVIDPVDNYLEVLRDVFDLDALRALISRADFALRFDAMHAVTGEYARRVLVDELGADAACVLRGESLPDFGGGHPDPNLTYAADLVAAMAHTDAPALGAASDGDGDRNMILGADGVFVSPADSVAIIADHAVEAIPHFRDGLLGVARSMPTASALDRVAALRGLPVYETPTGWKFFTNLMDAKRIRLCGEESFGTGSDHVREKDGLWAVLCWLSILAVKNRDKPIGELVSVKDVLLEHWITYGRTYTLRHDYENVTSEAGALVIDHLRALATAPEKWPSDVKLIDEYCYVDPVDGSTTEKQGIRIFMKDGSRIVCRLSGTGSTGATVRLYFESYEAPSDDFSIKPVKEVLEGVVLRARAIAKLEELTGRHSPTVIT